MSSSFTEQQTQLLSSVSQLVDTMNQKENEISQQVAKAIAGLTSQERWVYVDPADGVDTNNGTSWDDAVLTLDRAVEITATNLAARFLLAGNVTLKNRHYSSANSIYITGLSTSNQTITVTVSFLNEALNSPNWQGHKMIAGIENVGQFVLTSAYVNFELPAIDNSFVINHAMTGGSGSLCVLRSGSITCSDPTSTAALISSWFPAPIDVYMAGMTISANAAGKIINGLGTGVDPNTNLRFRSNMTSL